MAYLDEDILYNNVEEKYKYAKGKAREAYSDVLDTICEMPRADVVPKSDVLEMQKEQLGRLKEIKSEVERVSVEYEAMRGAANSYKMHYEKAKAEVAREIFEDIWAHIATRAFTSKSDDYADGSYDTISWVDEKIQEVEKKYTEGE